MDSGGNEGVGETCVLGARGTRVRGFAHVKRSDSEKVGGGILRLNWQALLRGRQKRR